MREVELFLVSFLHCLKRLRHTAYTLDELTIRFGQRKHMYI